MSAGDVQWPPPVARYYALGLLCLCYVLSLIDRTILTLLVGPIRHDLHISDTQVSVLHGLAFAILYTTIGVPVARMADTRSRRALIALGIGLWSLATAMCGVARSFATLFLGRVAVGVGESTLSPAAYSLIADAFPPAQLGGALGFYNGAIYVGAGLAMMVGGSVVHAAMGLGTVSLPLLGSIRGWQLVFFIVGIPGLLLVPLVATMREPARRGSARAYTQSGLFGVLHWMRQHARVYLGHIVGFTLISAVYNVGVGWGPTFLIRRFGYDAGQAGHAAGMALLVCGTSGAIVGGWLSDRWRRVGFPDAPIRVGILSAVSGAIPATIATLSATPASYLALFALSLFCASLAFGAAAAALQLVTPGHLRAQVSAIYLLVLNLFALGLAPTVTALITDYAFRRDGAVGESMAIVSAVCSPLAALTLWYGCKPFGRLAAASAQSDVAVGSVVSAAGNTSGVGKA